MLELVEPYDRGQVLRWLAARAIPGVEAVDPVAGTYARTTPDGILRATITDRAVVVERARDAAAVARILDLAADPLAIAAALRRDPALAPLVAARPGVRVPGAYDAFELTVRAILGQQVSVAAATTVAGRLVAAAGAPIDGAADGPLTHRFPTPDALAEAEIPFVPAPRARSLRAVARAAAAGELDPADQDVLTALPGIGPWTAAYVAMRAGGDADAYPESDLVLRRMVAAARADPERWRPYRAYGAMHLWAAAAAGG